MASSLPDSPELPGAKDVFAMKKKNLVRTLLLCVGVVFLFYGPHAAAAQAYPPLTNDASLHLPLVGQNELHILSSNLLELKLFTTKSLASGVGQWNFVSVPGLPQFPGASEFVVSVNGQT